MNPRAILLDLFHTAVAAAQASKRMPQFLPPPPRGRTIVIGAGKAAAEMAAQLEAVWPGRLEGVVVTRYGHAVPCRHIRVLEAAHPFPDDNGIAAAREIRAACRLDEAGSELLRSAITRLALSARAFHRVLKLARTVADLAGSESIEASHVAEAIQYRALDRRR